ncbi:M20/M25/M40 family metallo-hydrolase, partial [Pseudophaeobacter sp.]|uniref:M20/M25/M40 family metallo-hydrolase n=1 Tax=Pseudophaeobacter sp. TaxID=1971739 RepID=UPI00345559BE
DARMDRLVQEAEAQLERALAKAAQQAGGRAEHVSATVTWHDVFLATVNDDRALTIASTAASTLGLSTYSMGQPMRWSEDFGRFGLDGAKAAMVFIGSGESQPQLHNPNYDYPDGLTPTGVALLVEIVDQLLGRQGDAHAQPNISGN